MAARVLILAFLFFCWLYIVFGDYRWRALTKPRKYKARRR